MKIASIIAFTLVIIGALVWLLVGIFDFNLVATIFAGPRAAGAVIVYTLIALAAIWLIISPIVSGGILKLQGHREVVRETR